MKSVEPPWIEREDDEYAKNIMNMGGSGAGYEPIRIRCIIDRSHLELVIRDHLEKLVRDVSEHE